ncbi:MAG: hypothetical protein ACE5R4_01455 [Armatimonadota bacterium]
MALCLACIVAALCLGYISWAKPLTFVLPRRGVIGVLVRFREREVKLTDPASIARFRAAVLAGRYDLPYATRCVEGGAFSVTFLRQHGAPFEVHIGLDDCDTLYCPALGRTYTDRGDVRELAEEALGAKLEDLLRGDRR